VSEQPKTARTLHPIVAFALLTLLAGFGAVIAVHLVLISLSALEVEAASTLRTEDAVCLLESAWAAGAAAFAFWGSRLKNQTRARRVPGLERWGLLVSFALTSLALTMAGVFIERLTGSSARAPSLRSALSALFLASALFYAIRRRGAAA
jgi:hypothetical protein